nr:DUF3574 domain-containing protein [Komagataeibacter xylinus]
MTRQTVPSIMSPRRHNRRFMPVVLAALAIPGWAHATMARTLPTAAPPATAPDMLGSTCTAVHGQMGLRVSLMFGMYRPHGKKITKQEWDDFLRDTVTPRFPAGLSVFQADGQWQDRETGRVGHEPSHIIWIVTPQIPDLSDRIAAIRQAYTTRFQQQSVGLSITAGCSSF